MSQPHFTGGAGGSRTRLRIPAEVLAEDSLALEGARCGSRPPGGGGNCHGEYGRGRSGGRSAAGLHCQLTGFSEEREMLSCVARGNPLVDRPRPGGITWQIAGERLGLLSWPRAVLLQLAHPLVAAGVAAHSEFRASPLAPYSRLHATVAAMRALAFGTDQQAEAALAGILRIHDRVHGALGGGVGAHAAGAPYTAHDPALLQWVHATLIDSAARLMDEVIRPLTVPERDQYCRESAPLAAALGAAAADLPQDWATLQRYIEDEIASGRVAVGDQARALAPGILRPPLGWLAWPLQRASELITIGSLPDPIRAQYGFDWNAARARRRQRVLGMLRRTRRWTPLALARWPEARA